MGSGLDVWDGGIAAAGERIRGWKTDDGGDKEESYSTRIYQYTRKSQECVMGRRHATFHLAL